MLDAEALYSLLFLQLTAAHVAIDAGRSVDLHRGDDGRFSFESASHVD